MCHFKFRISIDINCWIEWNRNFRLFNDEAATFGLCVYAMSLSIARDRNHKNVICLNSDDFSRHLIGPPPLLKIDAEQSKSVIFLFLLFGCHQKWDTEHTARHKNTVIKFYFASMAEKSAHFGIQASFFFITRNLFRNEHKQKMSTFYFFDNHTQRISKRTWFCFASFTTL